MKAIIMAGGADEKWTLLGGESRRHFQLVCGERVLDRIVRQLKERGVADIGITCPDIDGYDVPGTYRITPAEQEWGYEPLNGQEHWSTDGRTIQVYGDTIFTDTAMDTIVAFDKPVWQMFGRFGHGVIKRGGGELFACSFWPEQQSQWVSAMELAFALKRDGITKRASAWEGYRIMGGARGWFVGKHRFYPEVFTQVRDGLTDDFDTPAQFEALRDLFERMARLQPV